MKRILIIDGQGGGMGAQLAKLLLPKLPADCELLAVGTNVLATSAMLKAGAVCGATGENAVVYNAARADVILGPIGILMATESWERFLPTCRWRFPAVRQPRF